MSASTKRKIRQASREAGTDKKIIAAQEEAAKKAKSKRRWTIGTIAVILFIAIVLLLDSPLMYSATTALTVNGEKLSPAQVSYHYANQYMTFANQYGEYASYFGLDTSSGLPGLRNQPCDMMEEGGTWRDYFLSLATNEIQQSAALRAYAAENGITLDPSEIDTIDRNLASIDTVAAMYGYPSGDKYISVNYGTGVNKQILRQASIDSALAAKAYEFKENSLQYSAEQLAEKYASYEGAKDSYSFAYYYVSASESSGVTAEQAKETADKILEAYNSVKGGDDYARFTAAVESVTGESAARTRNSRENITADYAEWLTGSRTAGEATAIANADNTGWYVVLFLDSSDNNYNVAQVRHILVKAAADENGVYSNAAKAEALAKAENILAEWKAGAATEDSFAALAEQYSEDEGSSTNGGLYDSIAKGQMVEEFDKFCFEGHKAGDTAIVYGDNGAYAGYHIMYYVGEGELYSGILAKNDLMNADMTEWFEALVAACPMENGFGLKLVG